jgi:hypothetical protein
VNSLMAYFDRAVSWSDCNRAQLQDELQSLQEEEFIIQFQALWKYLPGGAEKSHGTLSKASSLSCPELNRKRSEYKTTATQSTLSFGMTLQNTGVETVTVNKQQYVLELTVHRQNISC